MQTQEELREYVSALAKKDLVQFSKECGVRVNVLRQLRGGAGIMLTTAVKIVEAINARRANEGGADED